MNSDAPKSPREELELRITALLLGELSADEAAAVREALAMDAELAKLHEDLKQTIVLVREASSIKEAAAPQTEPLKLSETRRQKLLTAFMIPPLKKNDRKPGRSFRVTLIEVLVVVSLVAIMAAMLLPSLGKAKSRSQRVAVHNNLRQLEMAKQMWADENKVPAEVAPSFDDLKPYLGRGEMPAVASEKYIVGKVGEPPSAVMEADKSRSWFGNFKQTTEPGRRITLSGKDSLAAANQNSPGNDFALVSPNSQEIERTVSRDDKLGYYAYDSSVRPAVAPVLPPPVVAKIELPTLATVEPGATAGIELAGRPESGVRQIVRDSSVAAGGGRGGGGAGGGNKGVVTPLPRSGYAHSVNLRGARALDETKTVSSTVSESEGLARIPRPQESSQVLALGRIDPAAGLEVNGEKDAAVHDSKVVGYAGVPILGETPIFGKTFETAAATKSSGSLGVSEKAPADRFGEVQDSSALAGRVLDRFYRLEPQTGSPAKEKLGEERREAKGRSQLDAVDIAALGVENRQSDGRADILRKRVDSGKESKTLPNRRAGIQKAPQTISPFADGDNDQPVRKPQQNVPTPQPEIQTIENNFSTFSLNVSDVSFKLAAASLEQGQMPDAASIRSEEFINAFDYRDPEPAAGSPIAFAWERARYPFAHNRDLLRFSLKTAAAGRQSGRSLNIVLLLDNSGSMERSDRVRIIREALRVLASQLQAQDKLSVITFARTARLVADGISGDKAGGVAEQVSGLTPQGGTNLEDAMNLAYQTAARHYLASGINRVVLLTDGAANLGDLEPTSLKQKVEAQRQQGIALDCFGIGWEGFNDDLLEVLSRNGDGRYGFINSPEEAATDFAGQLAGALKVAASDVKVQVEFNPNRVTAYRQIGYAKHQLTKEQFRDNTVDAAEIAAQEAGNALYTVELNPGGAGPIATVRVRYKAPGTTDYREQAWDVPYTGNAVSLEVASPAMRLAASASAFSEWLVASPFAGEVNPDALLGYLSGVPEVYGADSRPKKLEWMIRQAKSIERR